MKPIKIEITAAHIERAQDYKALQNEEAVARAFASAFPDVGFSVGPKLVYAYGCAEPGSLIPLPVEVKMAYDRAPRGGSLAPFAFFLFGQTARLLRALQRRSCDRKNLHGKLTASRILELRCGNNLFAPKPAGKEVFA